MPVQDRRPSFSDGTPIGEGVKPDEVDDAVVEPAVAEDDDEVIVPPSEGEGTPADPAENNDPDGTIEELEPVDASPEVEKPRVITESADSLEAKKAELLKEVQELRAERRGLKGNPFEKKISPNEEPLFTKPQEDPLKDVNPDDRSIIEKVVEARLKSEGYVRKDELQSMTLKDKVQQQTDAWVRENTEFDKDNDPDDSKWNKINAYVSRMFAPPSKPDDVKEMLDIARERLFGKKTSSLPQKSINSIAAKKEKLAISAKPSSGGGTSAKDSSAGKFSEKIDPNLLGHLKGFSEEELKELVS